MLELTQLYDGQQVEVRLARGDVYNETTGSYDDNWKEWRPATLWLVRRDKPLKGKRGKEIGGRAGDIIGLTVREVEWAEYTQKDYDPQFDTWTAEDYSMQIRLP